jgi:hypothetical protein
MDIVIRRADESDWQDLRSVRLKALRQTHLYFARIIRQNLR